MVFDLLDGNNLASESEKISFTLMTNCLFSKSKLRRPFIKVWSTILNDSDGLDEL